MPITIGQGSNMSLKVHMMGPRDTKFPYKAQGSWFIKLNNMTHSYLQDRMIEKNETLEEALLGALTEGMNIMLKEKNNANE